MNRSHNPMEFVPEMRRKPIMRSGFRASLVVWFDLKDGRLLIRFFLENGRGTAGDVPLSFRK